MKAFKVVFLLIFVCLALNTPLTAQPETADSLLAKILMKLVSFDKNIDRLGDPIKIGVTDDGILKALRQMGETKILGKKFVSLKLLLPEEVAKCSVVYIGASLKENYDDIIKAAKEKKVLTFCSNRNYLKKGFAVALEIEDGMPILWLNLVNASDQGSVISLDSLKLVMIKGKLKE